VESAETGSPLGVALAPSLGAAVGEGVAGSGEAVGAAEAVGSGEPVGCADAEGEGVATSGGMVGAGVATGLGEELATVAGVLAGADAPGSTVTQPLTVNMMGIAASASREWRMSLLWANVATVRSAVACPSLCGSLTGHDRRMT